MTGAALGIEVAIPFLIFFPRRLRMFGAWCLIGMQVLILLTGNYTFFNLLTIALTLFLFDDQALARFVPAPIIGKIVGSRNGHGTRARRRSRRRCGDGLKPLAPVRDLKRPSAPVSKNRGSLYGAAANRQHLRIVRRDDHATHRDRLSKDRADGETWQPYEFKYKPGDVNRAPGWVAPYQPRLDWQMWFAALSNYQTNPWFVNLALQLLNGSPDVAGFLARIRFPNRPPRFIRATAYEYTFTDWETHRRTGAWWKRERRGLYLPPVGLRSAASQ